MSALSITWLAQLIFGIASIGSALTVLLMAWMVWVLSGVPRLRLERDLAALRRLDELDAEDVTWRQGARAAAGRWARASVRLNPLAANRPSDVEWQRSLLQRHRPKIEEAGGLEHYAARVRLDALEGVTALLALATGADRARRHRRALERDRRAAACRHRGRAGRGVPAAAERRGMAGRPVPGLGAAARSEDLAVLE